MYIRDKKIEVAGSSFCRNAGFPTSFPMLLKYSLFYAVYAASFGGCYRRSGATERSNLHRPNPLRMGPMSRNGGNLQETYAAYRPRTEKTRNQLFDCSLAPDWHTSPVTSLTNWPTLQPTPLPWALHHSCFGASNASLLVNTNDWHTLHWTIKSFLHPLYTVRVHHKRGV